MESGLSVKERKRLAIYLPTLVGGGAERVMMNLAVEFVRRGYPLDFVLAQFEGAFTAEFPPSVKKTVLNPIQLKFGRSLFSLPDLVRYIRRERPAALLTGLHANIIAIWAKRLAGVPLRVVIIEHNTLSLRRRTQTFVYRYGLSWLIKRFYPLADAIIAVSEGVADDLAKYARMPRGKIMVVDNPIITPELMAKSREAPDHPWFKPGEPPVILSVGRLTMQKDYPLLIKAFADVRRAMPARLIILGDGPDREELENLVKQLGLQEEVSLPGFVHNPYAYMAHAAAFVLSSLWEGLPTVLVEALYCGAPIIATDCQSGPREILRNGEFGQLVPVGDQKALTEAIEATIKNARIPPGEESWQPFTVDHVVDQYLSILFSE